MARQESVRDVYLADNRDDAAVLIDKAIAGCAADDVTEIQSLGNTLRSWRFTRPIWAVRGLEHRDALRWSCLARCGFVGGWSCLGLRVDGWTG